MKYSHPLHLLARCIAITMLPSFTSAAQMNGVVRDSATDQPIAARVYLRDTNGKHFHVDSDDGKVIPYDVRRSDTSLEVHSTVSANSFNAELDPGKYILTVEKGKEYFPETREIVIRDGPTNSVTIPIRRWTNMAERGWYSGETHVHRNVTELPTLQQAEDLNVAFPLTAWVTESEHTPAANNKNKQAVPPAKLFKIDSTHVFWPINTEYEIFTVKGKQHTLGAVFILNHREQLNLPTPPVGPIAVEAKRQGGFLELDKHNWPWSMMLVPQMGVELYELTNNHIWRTDFLYKNWYPEYVSPYMQIEMLDGNFTERGWIDFGFQNYYALLNCGYKMKPTAGTASGVHPVPFGYGRVYVKLDGEFSYDKWVAGLLTGNSFVTTGPMLTSNMRRIANDSVRIDGRLESPSQPVAIEVIRNGKVVKTIDIEEARLDNDGVYRIPFDVTLELGGSSWFVVRAFAKRTVSDRVSFAHTAPAYFDVEGKPLLPTQDQRDYLVKRVRDEITRNRGVISTEAMSEFESALRAFESKKAIDADSNK